MAPKPLSSSLTSPTNSQPYVSMGPFQAGSAMLALIPQEHPFPQYATWQLSWHGCVGTYWIKSVFMCVCVCVCVCVGNHPQPPRARHPTHTRKPILHKHQPCTQRLRHPTTPTHRHHRPLRHTPTPPPRRQQHSQWQRPAARSRQRLGGRRSRRRRRRRGRRRNVQPA